MSQLSKKYFTLSVVDRRTGKQEYVELPLNLKLEKVPDSVPSLNSHFFPARFTEGGLEFLPGLLCDPLFVEAHYLHCKLAYTEEESPSIAKRLKK